MIRYNEKLDVIFSDNGVFSDKSNNLLDYSRGFEDFSYISSEDFIFIGFYKPINTVYVEMNAVSPDSESITLEYFNGSSYVGCEGLYDDTDGFTRSGFLRWNRGQSEESEAVVDGSTKYWYRLSLSGDTSFSIKGLNIVFSDDQDIKREVFEIDKFLPKNETSHILTHVAARDEIIQRLNNSGRAKHVGNEKYDITSFDLLDVSQVKLASTKLAIAKIYHAASDEVDDSYYQKYEAYKSEADGIIQNMYIDTDIDDDGVSDIGEKRIKLNYGVIKRR